MVTHVLRSFLLSVIAGASLLGVPVWAAPAPVRIQNQYEPASLDPHKIHGLGEHRIATDLFEGLATYSATDTVIPGVAQSWETSADGLTWTFHLQAGATWSDGTPLTAEDFVYSFRRALDPATGCPDTSALLPIRNAAEINSGREKDMTKLGVTALDPHTLRIVLNSRTPWFLDTLIGPVGMPVPRQAVEKWGDKWTLPGHMVSNGAFTLNKWVPLGEIALVRNPQFHDAGAVALGEVDYVMGDDHSAALKRYEADELDVVSLLGADLQRIQHERPDELHSNPQLTTYYFLFNMSAGIDPHVRRALSMVIDRDVLESKIVRGDQRPAYGLVPPGLPGYVVQRPEWADLPMAERIAAAKALLAEADIGKPLKIHILAPKLDSLQLDINAILAMWHSALGIDAEVEIVEPRIFLNRYDQNDFEVVYLPVTGDYLDPWDLLSGFLSDKKFDNYGNSKYDALLDESRRAASSADRMALLRSAEALLLADQPLIPVSYGTVQLLVKPRLHGYESAPLGIHPSRFLRVTDMP